MKSKLNFGIMSAAALILLLAATSCQKEDHSPSAASDNEAILKSMAPTRNADIVHVPLFIEDYNYTAPSSDTVQLYTVLGHQPVLAPDGHHITLGEFNMPTGRASLKCINQGTHVVLNLHHLIPNGVYTVWVLVFQSPGFTPTFENLTAIGSMGANDGSQNIFTADENGDASISATTPGGPLSMTGSIAACASDEFEVHFVGAYHIDGQTYGPTPGPNGTYVEQIGFIFHQ